MAKQDTDEKGLQVYEYGEDSGLGLELAPPPPIPRLKIVQGGEKEIGVKGSAYEKAEAGQILDTGTKRLYESIQVIPCFVNRVWLEWESSDPKNVPPINTYLERPTHAKWIEGEGLKTRDGTYIVETRSFYVLTIEKTILGEPCILDMNKTAIKISTLWLQDMYSSEIAEDGESHIKVPIFARQYVISTARLNNDVHSWHAWNIKMIPGLIDPKGRTYAECRDFYNLAKAHAMQIRSMGNSGFSDVVVEDDIPF